MSDIKGTAVVTGASTGLGAVYADRLARRGYDLLLVARDKARLDALAAQVAASTGRKADVLATDLTDSTQLARVEERLRTDESITLLVNNAGGSLFAPLTGADPDALEQLVALNVTSLTRLTVAALDGFARRHSGTIVNLSSALALNVLPVSAAYSGTKSYVLAFTQALLQEVARGRYPRPGRVPGRGAHRVLGRLRHRGDRVPGRVGYDRRGRRRRGLGRTGRGREAMTFLSLPDNADWEAFDAARQALIPNLSRSAPADRYRG